MQTTTDTESLAGLNNAQREVVLHVDGPLLVLAGAGSGKTRALTTRIARLVDTHGVDPAAILAVTFTNKAAGEMRDRIGRLLGRSPAGMWAGTFHSLGARLLRANAHLVGRTPAFTIYDEDDSLSVVKRIMEKHSISPREWTPKAIFGSISNARNALTSPTDFARAAKDPLARAAAVVYPDLEGALRQCNAVTFDDLLALPVQLLMQNPQVLERYQERFRYLLVDEYQDTNHAQYRLVSMLGAAHGNVLVVGDDDQSIYGWRGADIRNILEFERDFPNARVILLEDNYRSTPEILDLANDAISANANRHGKTLRATRRSGERPTAVAAIDERDEAEWVVGEIAARRRRESSLALRDFAILYRTNAQSRAMEESMRRHAVPYRLVGAVRFYDRREIRDLMAYLKLIANPADDEAFRRAITTPRRGVGDGAVATLAEAATARGWGLLEAARAAEMIPAIRPAPRAALLTFADIIDKLRVRAADSGVDELLGELIETIGYLDYLRAEGPAGAERIDNVHELVTGAAETVVDEGGEVGLTPLDHFLQKATLVAGIDSLDRDADAVTMMTMHNAKGLEFPVVFITGLEDGLFPLARARDDAALMEEERRLFYVGITRAESKLYMTHAESRRRNGEMLRSRPSTFLMDLRPEKLDRVRTVKVRSTGRASIGAFGGGPDSEAWGGRASFGGSEPTALRQGTPVFRRTSIPDYEDISQDQPEFVAGARVKHSRFGDGTIAEVVGSGPAAKVRVDFDDEEIGRKTLIVAQANLQRGDD
jgi:DNA helicase II / ATP-dependent DNA helicase PcrA